MVHASEPAATVDPREAAHFGRLADDWWDPRGSSAMLHKLNPVRLRYLRERIDAHWGKEPSDRKPLAGRKALDQFWTPPCPNVGQIVMNPGRLRFSVPSP